MAADGVASITGVAPVVGVASITNVGCGVAVAGPGVAKLPMVGIKVGMTIPLTGVKVD